MVYAGAFNVFVVKIHMLPNGVHRYEALNIHTAEFPAIDSSLTFPSILLTGVQ